MPKQIMKPEDYKGKKFSYPLDTIDPKKKREKQYYIDVNNALYADYINNRLAIPYGTIAGTRTIQELRLYATGRQTPDKIKKWLLRKNQAGEFVTKMNVSFDGYAKMPQLLDMMRSKNMNQEFDVSLTCIDDKSISTLEATREMMKFVVDPATQAFLKGTMFKPQVQPDPQEIGIQNQADVDAYIDSGGFTLQWQIAAEAACAKTKMESYYKEFQDQIFDDLITNPNGISGCKSYIEKSTKIPKFRRCDMTRTLCPPSEYRDFRDISRAAELRVMTISEISREHPSITSQQLYDIAQCFQWMNPPLLAFSGGYANWMNSPAYYTSNDPVMSARVFVLDSQWLSVNLETNIKNDRGFIKSVDFDYRLTAKDAKNGDEKIEKKVIKKYYSQWIVGSDILLDYGICEDVVYYGEDGNKRPRLDFFFTQTGNMSLVERCVALIDDMNMIIVKYRNGWASLPASPAMRIQQNLIENVMLNGKVQQPEDIIKTFIEMGVLYTNSLDDNGDPLFMAGGASPVDYMDVGKMVSVMAVCSQELAVKGNELREVLGLNNGADGGQKSPYQGLGETELAFQAANASLLPTFNSYNYLFVNLFTDIIKKWQIVAKGGAVKLPYSVLGVHNMKMLELGSEFTNSEFNVKVSIAPSTEERTAILQELTQLKVQGTQTNGSAGITHAQYLFLYEKVMSGQIKAAYFVLAKIEAQQRAEARKQQLEDQQANIQSQQASAQTKGDLDKQNIIEKGQQDKEKTLVEKLLEQNTMILQALLQGKKEGETKPNPGLAVETMGQNDQIVGNIVQPQQPQQSPQEEQMEPQQNPQEEMAEQPQMA